MVKVQSNNKKSITLDIETTGLAAYYGSRITSIAAKDGDGNWFKKVGGPEKDLILVFLDWMTRKSPKKYFLVTHNGKTFDVPFILGRAEVVDPDWRGPKMLLSYEHHDTKEMAELLGKRWKSLSALSKEYGCPLKSGSGLGAIDLWNQGRHRELLEYNVQDVECTEALYFKLKEELKKVGLGAQKACDL